MSTSPKPPSPAALKRQVDDWNNAHPLIGVPVIVKLDDGTEMATRTRSQAEILSGHSAVIWLEGISGCYLLNRVRHNPKPDAAPQTVKPRPELFTIHSTEDEMIFLHGPNGYAATLYASCPEQACDFQAAHSRSRLALDAWGSVLRSFQKNWTCKHQE